MLRLLDRDAAFAPPIPNLGQEVMPAELVGRDELRTLLAVRLDVLRLHNDACETPVSMLRKLSMWLLIGFTSYRLAVIVLPGG